MTILYVAIVFDYGYEKKTYTSGAIMSYAHEAEGFPSEIILNDGRKTQYYIKKPQPITEVHNG